jgi:hypothetical protein
VKVIKVSAERPGGTGMLQAALPGLLRGTRYSITVSCYNSAGSGPPSPPVYYTTQQGGLIIKIINILHTNFL